MNFNAHYNLKDKHAFLSASSYHWLNYSDDKLLKSWETNQAKALGTRLHALAAEHIELGIKMPKTKNTLNMYINDAIGFKMQPEQILYYSDNCFGTADAISFRNDMLRIHDLKTGEIPAHMEQLEIYASLFCLEYGYKPNAIDMELRIYQNNEIIVHEPENDKIDFIMSKIINFDKLINQRKAEE